MPDLDLVIRAERVVIGSSEVARTIGVRAGSIVAIEPISSPLSAPLRLELGDDEVLIPGLTDTHVHVNEPGRTDWEGFTTATKAAASGGITTIVDMPLNSIPPTCDVPALELKRKSAEGKIYVDVGFWGGAIPGNLPHIRSLHDAGVLGFKSFLVHSGVDEFPPLTPAELEAAMREVRAVDGLLLLHAEDARAIERAPAAHGPAYASFLASRPRGSENLAVAEVIEMARWIGCHIHILHVSSSDVLPMIASARHDGVRVTAETCPHYLTFAAEAIPDGATHFKCCPPIREARNRELLWQGMRDGVIDMVVSDHSPSTPDLKCLDTGDFGAAWGGISSLQLALSVVWTEARDRDFALTDTVRWMCEAPATRARLLHKGRCALGYDADFCVFAPEDTYVVDARKLQHKNTITPYDGRPLTGVVRSTWLRGEQVDIDAAPKGHLLTREGAAHDH